MVKRSVYRDKEGVWKKVAIDRDEPAINPIQEEAEGEETEGDPVWKQASETVFRYYEERTPGSYPPARGL